MPDVLVDASALVALLNGGDVHHDRCVDALKSIRDPLATVWPALTEAMHLLAGNPPAPAALCDMVTDGALRLADLDASAFARIKALMRKYHDVPMDFADAALVVVAERERLTRIVTFDRDFDIYRLPRRARFAVLPSRAGTA